MELHHIGKHCDLESCNKLDFLPFSCIGCKKNFCEEHYKQADHQCEKPSVLTDVKVPVCPICQQPIPVSKGQDPNIKVHQHINNGCKNVEKKKEICHLDECKTLVTQVFHQCKICNFKFCLKHRFPENHACQPPPPPKAGLPWMNKSNNNATNKKKDKKSDKKNDKKCIIC